MGWEADSEFVCTANKQWCCHLENIARERNVTEMIKIIMHCFIGRGSSEKMGRSTRAGERSGMGACRLPICESSGCDPRKIFENIYANLWGLMHFWRRVQQKIYNSLFNLYFGRSVWWQEVIKTGTENRRFYRACRIGSAAPAPC